MKITICGSLNFTFEIKDIADQLKAQGHEVFIPLTSEKILSGEISLDDIKNLKNVGSFHERCVEYDAIRNYYEVIKKADAILVANFEKKGIKGYIGGNSFLEMGFAHILKMPIFLLNPIPDMPYIDELKAMQPIVLSGNLKNIPSLCT